MVCANGSAPLPTAPAYTYIGRETLRGWLSGTAWAWLLPVIDMTSPAQYKVADLCAVDAPVPTPFTAAEIACITDATCIGLNPGTVGTVLGKLTAWAKAYAWSDNCACNVIGGTCTQFSSAGPYSSTNVGQYNGGRASVPVGGHAELYLTATKGTFGGAGVVQIRFAWENPHGTFLSWDGAAVNLVYGTVYHYVSGSPPAGATGWSVWFLTTTTGSGAWPTLSWDSYYCGGPWGGALQPAPADPPKPAGVADYPVVVCASNADICDQISQLTAKLGYARAMIDLIQRQGVPFAYIAGAVHAVSGTGTVSVQGIIGLKVALTLPASLGASGSNPTKRFDIGHIAFGTADGWGRRQWIESAADLFFPLSGAITRVGYDLAPGVSGTLSELIREA